MSELGTFAETARMPHLIHAVSPKLHFGTRVRVGTGVAG